MIASSPNPTGRLPARYRALPVALGAALCLWPLTGPAGTALAQEGTATGAQPAKPNWPEIRVEEPKGARKAGTDSLRDGTITDEKLFDAYWEWYLSQFTWHRKRTDLAELRRYFKNQLRNRKGPAQERLVRTIALPMMSEIAGDEKYAPLVRFNALLLVGELNEVEPEGTARGVALPEALLELLKFLDAKQPVDDAHDALRVAALVGLLNHAERGGIADKNARDQVVKKMQDILAEQSPSGRAAEVHKWIQKRARTVLEALGQQNIVAQQPPAERTRP